MAYFETEIEGIQCIVNVMKTENPDRYVQQIASAAHKLHEKTKGIDYARMGELAGMEDSHTSMLRARERFSINNCIITGWPGTIQACLEVTAPDGNKSRITIGENGMRYLGASSSNGFDKGNLPLGALLCAGYFLPAERTAANKFHREIADIIQGSIALPQAMTRAQNIAHRMVIRYTCPTELAVDLYHLRPNWSPEPRDGLAVKASLISIGQIEGLAVYSERCMLVYRLPGKADRYGIFFKDTGEIAGVIEQGVVRRINSSRRNLNLPVALSFQADGGIKGSTRIDLEQGVKIDTIPNHPTGNSVTHYVTPLYGPQSSVKEAIMKLAGGRTPYNHLC